MRTKQNKTEKRIRREPSSQSPNRQQIEPLDKSSFIPLYFQIQDRLVKQIRSGDLQVGDMLPGEEDLCRLYGVSRMTARQSLQALKHHGLIRSEKGRGTFVVQPKVEKKITHLSGFSAEMRSLGMKPSSRILEQATKAASPEIALRLGVSPGLPLLELHRLRLADALPLAIEQVWLSLAEFPGIEKIDFTRNSLYETLRERYGIQIGSADEIIEARAPTNREAKLLEISPRQSLLVISRTIRTVQGKPVEESLSLYRGDRYRAVLNIPATIVE
ncbi:MAG TPA: GntR family transcriptional regulator [Acidobacteriaceae bacterium]|nr:GntR family transcriptional regulator [Acidobacteriaceae bacterium]